MAIPCPRALCEAISYIHTYLLRRGRNHSNRQVFPISDPEMNGPAFYFLGITHPEDSLSHSLESTGRIIEIPYLDFIQLRERGGWEPLRSRSLILRWMIPSVVNDSF